MESHGDLEPQPRQTEMLLCGSSTSSSLGASSSSLSAMSPLDDSPCQPQHTPRVRFVPLNKIATPVDRNSPVTPPKVQLKIMEKRVVKHHDSIIALERDLTTTQDQLAEKELEIKQLQHLLDKRKRELGEQESAAREQLQTLESKLDQLQGHRAELLREVNGLKSNTTAMERKIDQLTSENGDLSVQTRDMKSKLTMSNAAFHTLTETHAAAQGEWTAQATRLQSELCQAQHAKDNLEEQVLILASKVKSLEDDLQNAIKEERGENMGPIMERELEDQLKAVKNDLEYTVDSLKKAEEQVYNLHTDLATVTSFSDAKDQQLESLRAEVALQTVMVGELRESLTNAVKEAQAKEDLLAINEEEHARQRVMLEAQVAASQEEVRRLCSEVKSKEGQLALQKEERSRQSLLLQQDIQRKSEAAEHYKAQMDRAVRHYNGKKELHQQSQEQVSDLHRSLAEKEGEVKLLQTDLEQAHGNEQRLQATIASLETQLAFASRNLREHSRLHGGEWRVTQSAYFAVPLPTTVQSRLTSSSDGELNDSLESTSTSKLESSLSHLPDPPAVMKTTCPGTAGEVLPSNPRMFHKCKGPLYDGVENEPDGVSEDWMRIAELQARNKMQLPHLKCSYPLEPRPSLCPDFTVSDEELRTGDPLETMRQATLMPGQLQDSLTSHRLSFMGPPGAIAAAGQESRRGSKRPAANEPLHSPEAKRMVTSKSRQICDGASSSSRSELRVPLSPVHRRDVCFTIENTPKNYLQKGLKKLRSLKRKSPGKGSRKAGLTASACKGPDTDLSAAMDKRD